MVYFVCPDPDAFISGGNVFNNQIREGLTELGIPHLQSGINQLNELILQPEDVLLFDSIYLDELSRFPLNELKSVKILLVHLLPSMINLQPDQELEKLTLSQFDLVLANSSFTRDYLLSLDLAPSRIKTVQPWIQKSDLQNNPDKEKIILVANWLPAKQIDRFFQELILFDLPEDLKIYLYGDTQIDKKYTRYCMSIMRANPILQKHILIKGPVTRDEIDKVYAEGKCLVDVSGFETYGMAVAEALVAELQVLTLGAGHCQQHIGQGRCKGCNDMNELIKDLIAIHTNVLVVQAAPVKNIVIGKEQFVDQLRHVFNPITRRGYSNP